MPRFFILTICLASGCFRGFPLWAQSTFIRIGADQSLSSLQVTSLFQDKYGFVWIGTPYGLNRFDAYQCEQYFNIPGDTSSLSSNFISPHAFYEDDAGNLWIATFRGGLNVFLRDKERFASYRAKRDSSNALTMDKLSALEPDGKGGIWIATAGNGINHFNPRSGKFRSWNERENRPGLLMGSTMISCLKQDRKGVLWIGTNKGLCRFHPESETFDYFPFDGIRAGGLSDGFITDIQEDRFGRVWIATANGLNRWNPETASFAPFPLAPEWNDPGFKHIHTLCDDGTGRLWLGTNSGLLLFDPVKNTYRVFPHEPGNPYSPQKGPVTAILKDHEGNFWFGGANGITILNHGAHVLNAPKLEPMQQALASRMKTEGVNDVAEVGAWLWVATQTGIFKFSPGNSMQVVHPGNFNSLFFEPNSNWMYAGSTGDGFYIFEAVSGTLIRHVEKSQIGDVQTNQTVKGNRINDFAKDGAGFIWVAADGCLNRYDPSSGLCRKFQNTHKGNPNPSSNTNFCLLLDRSQNLWIGSQGGLSKVSKEQLLLPFDAPKLEFEHFIHQPERKNSINSDAVFCLLESRNGEIWAGAEAGLNRFTPQTQQWNWYFAPDGLAGNEVVSLVEDRLGNIWAASPQNGLSGFHRQADKFFVINRKDGLYAELFRPNSAICCADGALLFGARTGLAGFYPDSLYQSAPASPPFYFTSVKVFNDPLRLALPVYKTDRITFNYNQKIITFQFAALDFIHSEKQHYRFKLTPFHNNWQYTRDKREVTFTNLDPGEYRLEVQASGNGIDWQGKSLKFVVLAPWYRTWTAYAFYLALLLVTLLGMRRFELKRQTAKLETARLKELDQAKTQLYTNVTHEFRTPLTVILGMEEQMRTHPGQWTEEGLNLIRRNGKRLLQLVNQLLDLSKAESGHLSPDMVQSEVVSYLHYLTEAFHSYAESKDIRLHFRTEMADFQMDYDPEKLQTILSNLLSNAIKFTPPGGDVYIELSGENNLSGTEFQIQVSDNGPGITTEHLPHIFDRFYQIDDTNTRKAEGSGIGLSMVKELVKLLGGRIVAESPAFPGGKGTRFTICLPVHRNAPLEEGRHGEVLDPGIFPGMVADQAAGSVAPKTEQPTVLLVEDNSDVRIYLATVLQNDYRILHTNNGKEGLEQAFEHAPDLVVSDVMMPEMDGFDLCHILKTDERTSHIPVILLTAKTDSRAKLEGLRQGADAYLSKPFSPEELLVRIEKLIELRRSLQARFQHPGAWLPYLSQHTADPEDRFLQKTIRIIEGNLADEHFGMPELCKALNMSRSNLFRKIKSLSGQSVTGLIRNIRLEKARELLRQTDLNVSEVCFKVGFNSPNYFSRVFQEHFGMPPSFAAKG